MRYFENESPANLAEAERLAWAAGDTDQAAVLASLTDQANELTRLRQMYWTISESFPIESSAKKQDFIKLAQSTWAAIREAGDVGAA